MFRRTLSHETARGCLSQLTSLLSHSALFGIGRRHEETSCKNDISHRIDNRPKHISYIFEIAQITVHTETSPKTTNEINARPHRDLSFVLKFR